MKQFVIEDTKGDLSEAFLTALTACINQFDNIETTHRAVTNTTLIKITIKRNSSNLCSFDDFVKEFQSWFSNHSKANAENKVELLNYQKLFSYQYGPWSGDINSVSFASTKDELTLYGDIQSVQ